MTPGMNDYRWRIEIVMLMQRRAMIAAVALALGYVSAPSLANAQTRRDAPGPDTPRLLVVVFQAAEKLIGLQIADALRGRMTSASNPKQLYVIPKEQMVGFLESSGYKSDSSLGLTDLKELAKGLRADEILAGMISRASGVFTVRPRLMLAVDPAMGQPLPVVESGNLNDVARQIEKSASEARKQIPDHKACQNHIRAGAVDKAIVAANAGIAKYPNATIARNCLANAFQASKMSDSVLMVTEDIRRLDPNNSFATRMAFLAYKDKADAETVPEKQGQYREAEVRALVALLATDPANPTLTNTVVSELAKLGKPAIALPVIDTLLLSNPGDPQLIRQRWLLRLAAASTSDSASRPLQFASAIVAGEEMVKADTTLADSVYYARQVAAAMAVSPQRGAEYAAKAVQKFPANQDFWWYKANSERRSGQLQAAQQTTGRLVVLNPKYPNATVMLGQLFLEQNMTDSAVALARRAVAAGEDSKVWGTLLLRPAQDAVKKAQASDAEAKKDSTNKDKAAQSVVNWEAALAISQEADKLNPSATSKFFVGVSSFQVGYVSVQGAQKPKSCVLAKKAQDMFLITQMTMPQGGAVDAATAGQILGFVGQLATTADQMAKQYCK